MVFAQEAVLAAVSAPSGQKATAASGRVAHGILSGLERIVFEQ